MPSQTTRFENLLEAVPDALVGIDESGVIRFVNHQTESMFGYARDDLIGAPLETLVPESLQQVHAAHREGYDADPRTRSMGTEPGLSGRRRDGTEFPVDIALSPVDPGSDMVIIAAVRDMTNYRMAEGDHRRLDQLSAVVEFSGEAMMSSTLDGVITSWNPASERLYGYTSEEIIDKSIGLLNPNDRPGELEAILAKTKAGEHVENLQTMNVRKDGTVFAASLTVSPIRNENGAVVGTSVISRDVTEQKQTFEAVQRMVAIVENSEEAISSCTLDGIITSWNPAAERMFGYSSDEITDKSIGLLNPNDRPGELEAILAKIKAGEHVENFQTMNIRKDGTVFPVSVTVSPIRDENGTVIGASKIAHDLTRQMEASELARSMIEASLDTLVTISTEGKITDVNEAMVKATGVPREKIIGTSFSDYCTDPEKAEEIYQRTFSEGRTVDYPLTMRHRNGTLTEVLYNASVYRDARGNVIGVFAAARDVTKQVQAQREIAHQQAQALDRLAELERFQRLTVGRELKMIELKKEIEYLRKSRPADGGEPDDQH